MDSLLKRREGKSANLWDQLTLEVLNPIGIDVLPTLHTVEPDRTRGVPLLGYGLIANTDDVAKLTSQLQNGGRWEQRQLLHPGKLSEVLSEGYNRGKRTHWVHGANENYYYLSLWHLRIPMSECDITAAQMIGYGGNVVQLLPNDVTTFYFEDGRRWALSALARVAHQVQPLCEN